MRVIFTDLENPSAEPLLEVEGWTGPLPQPGAQVGLTIPLEGRIATVTMWKVGRRLPFWGIDAANPERGTPFAARVVVWLRRDV